MIIPVLFAAWCSKSNDNHVINQIADHFAQPRTIPSREKIDEIEKHEDRQFAVRVLDWLHAHCKRGTDSTSTLAKVIVSGESALLENWTRTVLLED